MKDYEKLAEEMRLKVEALEKDAEKHIAELNEILETLDKQIDNLNFKLELTDSQEDRLIELEDKYDFYEELRDRFDDAINDFISASSSLI